MSGDVITQERIKEVLEYDSITGEWKWKVSTGKRVSVGSVAGCINKNNGYHYIRIDGKQYLSSRLAWLYMKGEWPDEVDHIDRNVLNNSWSNLREANRFQNCQNQKLSASNTSGVKGVSWDDSRQKWRAKIVANGKIYHIGRYDKKENAIEARKLAEIKYHKEFRFQH